MYDVRKKCDKSKDGDLCYREMNWIDTWMNEPKHMEALGVDPSRLTNKVWRRIMIAHHKARLLGGRDEARKVSTFAAHVLPFLPPPHLTCDTLVPSHFPSYTSRPAFPTGQHGSKSLEHHCAGQAVGIARDHT